jgi:hypothetical protein
MRNKRTKIKQKIYVKLIFTFVLKGDAAADVMVTLPVQSTNVVAMQKSAAYNTIGI